MKKALALFFSLVIVFAFAGCSSEYDVFKDMDEKSKQFSHLNIDFDSIEVSDEETYDCTSVFAEADNVAILVYYDREEYKTSKRPKVLSMTAFSKANSFSDDVKNDLFNACKSMLLIDEWNLNSDDIESLNKSGRSDIKTPDGEKLTVSIDFETVGSVSIDTEEMRNRI